MMMMITTTTEKATVQAVDRDGVLLSSAVGQQKIGWYDLRCAATQATEPHERGHRGVPLDPNDECELEAFYRGILAQAERMASAGPLRVEVVTDTGGATWEVRCYDMAGRYDRSLMHADEGGSHPHRHLAEQEADDIRQRIMAAGRLA